MPQNVAPDKTLDINGSVGFREGSPLTLSSANHNVSLPDFSHLRIAGPTGAFSVSGLANGADGRILTLLNTTTQTMSVLNDNAASTAANRIRTGTGQDLSISPNGSVTLQYNTTTGAWFVIGFTSASTVNSWALTGNAGTNATTNFLGTTDNVALNFRTNNAERMRITEGGNVGVGTATPSNRLSVAGNQNVTGHLAAGALGIVDDASLLWTSVTTQSVISAQEEMSGTFSTNFQQGIASQIRLNASNRSSTETFSVRGEVETRSANAQYYNVVGGVVGAARHRGTDTVCTLAGFISHADNRSTGVAQSAIGLQATPYNSGTGKVLEAFGVWTHSIKNTSTGIVNNAFGIYVDDPTNTGTVSNNYGLYIKDQSTVGSVQSFNIFSAGSNAKNFFAGRVGIGINSPNAALQLGNTLANRRFVVWEDANNDHQFYGFGTNNGILRYQVSATTNNHIFYAGTSTTTSAELMRIQGNGSVGIATSTPDQILSVNGNASKSGGGTWATFSDRRVKRNVAPFTEGVATLSKIKPVTYQYNALSGYADTNKVHVGVIAQDVEQVAPYMVEKIKTAELVDKRVYDATALTYILVNAVKEQQAMIEQYQKQISETQSILQETLKRLENLEKSIQKLDTDALKAAANKQ